MPLIVMASDFYSSQILSKVQVAKACPANWREMEGNNRVRHCGTCSRNVYNISNMSRKEAADLIEKSGGKLCVRYYTRPDGGIMTRDCGKAIRTKVRFTALLSTILSTLGLGAFGLGAQRPLQGDVIYTGATTGKLAYPMPTTKPAAKPTPKKPAKSLPKSKSGGQESRTKH